MGAPRASWRCKCAASYHSSGNIRSLSTAASVILAGKGKHGDRVPCGACRCVQGTAQRGLHHRAAITPASGSQWAQHCSPRHARCPAVRLRRRAGRHGAGWTSCGVQRCLQAHGCAGGAVDAAGWWRVRAWSAILTQPSTQPCPCRPVGMRRPGSHLGCGSVWAPAGDWWRQGAHDQVLQREPGCSAVACHGACATREHSRWPRLDQDRASLPPTSSCGGWAERWDCLMSAG